MPVYTVRLTHFCDTPFIDTIFIPPGQADAEEYEGGIPDDIENLCPTQTNMSVLNTITGASNTFAVVSSQH